MTNRQKLLNRLEDVSDSMRSELQYYMQIDRDYEYDRVDAFFDLWDMIEMYKKKERALWSEIKDVITDAGMYIPYSDDMNIYVSSGKPYDFVHKEQKYILDKSPEMWINT